MIRQYDPPETIASRGRLQIDLRALRPMRFNDRDSLVIELDINELLGCIAENLRTAVKE